MAKNKMQYVCNGNAIEGKNAITAGLAALFFWPDSCFDLDALAEFPNTPVNRTSGKRGAFSPSGPASWSVLDAFADRPPVTSTLDHFYARHIQYRGVKK